MAALEFTGRGTSFSDVTTTPRLFSRARFSKPQRGTCRRSSPALGQGAGPVWFKGPCLGMRGSAPHAFVAFVHTVGSFSSKRR